MRGSDYAFSNHSHPNTQKLSLLERSGETSVRNPGHWVQKNNLNIKGALEKNLHNSLREQNH